MLPGIVIREIEWWISLYLKGASIPTLNNRDNPLISVCSFLNNHRFHPCRLASGHRLACADQRSNQSLTLLSHGARSNVSITSFGQLSNMVANNVLGTSTAATCIARTSLSWQLKDQDITCMSKLGGFDTEPDFGNSHFCRGRRP